MASESSSGGGIGFTGLLTIVLIALKLTHQIDWPWLWVLAPLWGSLAIILVLLILLGLIAWACGESKVSITRKYRS